MKLLSPFDRVLSARKDEDKEGLRVAGGSGVRRQTADVAGAIGERYETMNVGLDKLSAMLDQLRAFEPALKEMRQPLQAEYAARRADYIELVNLRSAHAETAAALEAASTEARTLISTRDAIEERLEETRQRLAEQTATAQEHMGQAEALRVAKSELEAKLLAQTEADRVAAEKIRRLEQDLEHVGTQLRDADTGRVEAAEGRAVAERGHALVVEENAALKRRLDEAQSEISRLARAEATLDGQLTSERARAQSEKSDATRSIQSLEGQVETARAELVGLETKHETLSARAERLDRLNAELTSRLNESQSAGQTSERRSGNLQIDLTRSQDKTKELESLLEESRQRHAATDAARQAAVERADQLAKSAAAAERGLARSEQRASKLQETIEALRAQNEAKARGLSEQMDALRARMQEAEAEQAMTAAALEASRRNRSNDSPSAANG